MNYKEKYSFFHNSLNPLETGVFCSLKNDKRYSINYSKVKSQFIEEIKNYQNYPELINIDEFSMNYSLGYHICNNIEDLASKESMYIEVKKYLEGLNFAA